MVAFFIELKGGLKEKRGLSDSSRAHTVIITSFWFCNFAEDCLWIEVAFGCLQKVIAKSLTTIKCSMLVEDGSIKILCFCKLWW